MSEKMQDDVKTDPLDRDTIHFEKLSEGVYALNFKNKSSSMKYTKEQILRYMEQENESKLRDVSHYFLNISGEYRRLVGHYSTLLTHDYLVIPKIKDQSVFESDKFEQDYQSILDYTDNSYIQEAMTFITYTIVTDGVFYGYERINNNVSTLQQLPPNYCRSTYKINGNYAVEFNLKFFDQYKDTNQKIDLFSLFPDEFLQLYLDYKDGNTTEWVQLNPEFARCHKLNDKHVPMLSTVFPELLNLADYKELDKSKDKMDLYRLIVQKLPVDKQTGMPLMKLEEGKALHQNAKKMITQEGVDVITTPLETDSINLQEKGQSLRDNIERAMNSVYNSAGSSRLIFNSGTDGGSIGLNDSIKSDETMMKPLLHQFKRWYDTKFNSLVKRRGYSFESLFPFITEYNRKEMFDLFKEAATYGYSKLLPVAALGIKQSTFMNLMAFENDYLKLHEKMIPLQSSHTQGNDPGAPEKDENDLSDKGLKQRETKANDNRAK